MTELCHRSILRNYSTEIYYGRYNGRSIMADILWHVYYEIYYSRCITADILWQIQYGRYMTAYIYTYLQIYIYIHMYIYIYIASNKSVISREMYRARSSRLLHPNLLVAMHRPKDSSPGSFYPVYAENGALFGWQE